MIDNLSVSSTLRPPGTTDNGLRRTACRDDAAHRCPWPQVTPFDSAAKNQPPTVLAFADGQSVSGGTRAERSTAHAGMVK